MSTLREAAQQALEALESCSAVPHWPALQPTITALRDALAQEEPEPVAWMLPGSNAIIMAATKVYRGVLAKDYTQPLYTHPPQALTKEDIAQNLQSRHDAAKLLEERRQEIAQPRRETQQEPAIYPDEAREMGLEEMPFYIHPPRREWRGLTTQEAMSLTDTAPKGIFYGCDAGMGLGIWIAAVAAAERALKEKNQ